MEKTFKQATFLQRHPLFKDFLSLIGFVGAVALGTFLLNTFIFKSYNVIGGSMENTLLGDDRVIVNRLTVSWSHFLGQEYIPQRGQIIVFANGSSSGELTCSAPSGIKDQYIIKRVIAFPGERVQVKDGILTVFNDEHPDGFVYDTLWRKSDTDGPKLHTSGEVDLIVPEGELFVSGDNREGSHSSDSRNGLGTIPYCRVVGPIIIRLFPFNRFRFFN
ncbi:signal peptidase I [Candidatus Saccharibacteria bacterium]|nr:signal peptidase I [Candidatus Saccharibacteria bacterium]